MNIRILCLGVLSTRDASGYELKKDIEDGKFSCFIEASFSSIYPALTQMCSEGLLTVRAEEQSGRPDKKVYTITAAGRAALTKGLTTVPAKDKYKSEFLFMMLFQDHLSKKRVELAIAKQHADLSESMARIAEARDKHGDKCNTPGAQFVIGYGECITSAALNYLETHSPRLKSQNPKH